jgi:ribosomal protein S9
MMRLTPLIALAALAAAGAAHAQGGGLSPEAHAAREAVRKACATESQSLCAGKEQHGMMACLRDNAAKLSAPCADAMSKMPPRQPHGQ